MNWIIFFCGAGCGAFVTIISILILVILSNKRNNTVNSRSIAALEERNQLERETLGYLERITTVLEQK